MFGLINAILVNIRDFFKTYEKSNGGDLSIIIAPIVMPLILVKAKCFI